MPIYCVGRPNYTGKLLEEIKKSEKKRNKRDLGFTIQIIDYELKDISSTLLRERLNAKESIDDITPPGVYEYMQKKNLIL